MPSNSSPSTRTSLVSIDPAVASHITSPKQSVKSLHMHTRADSSPGKTQGLLNSGHVKGHNRANSAPGKNHVRRSNSLRRTKNSTEMLRQRSKRDGDQRSADAATDPKRGRNFTVTNVGTGGMLYLRPSAYHNPLSQSFTALSPAPLSAPLMAPNTALMLSEGDDTHTPSALLPKHRRAVSSRTRSVSPRRLLERVQKFKETARSQRPSHVRSQSFSTLDESRRSISSIWPRTLRIVINRDESPNEKPPTADLKPSLEIPIPHYRLGIPRFSSHGTPILRNSTFSRASSTPSVKRGSTARHETATNAPPPASLKAFAKIQTLDPGSVEHAAMDHTHLNKRNVNDVPHRESKTVSIGYAPSIYDELNEIYNDSSVVRFAHDVRDVTAATPARIIAQISSESFMDYELVSDFFLTFRSYMSTSEVLDLLLARLAWAIGRMSDDGRIIRIRTFAALRHWILNYFMDDFVPHRQLRIRFCEEVNDLYTDVRSKQVGGPSDLKILQDLKRCWNGRCSLYWDSEEFNMDSSQDEDLVPGGVLGSRNPVYTHIGEVRPSPSQVQLLSVQSAPLPPERNASQSEPQSAPAYKHRHRMSHASSGVIASSESEQSFQPHSCSIRLPKTTGDGPAKLRKPKPVNVQERREKAPADLKVIVSRSNSKNQHHRRGGNSFDSTRERTPLPVLSPGAVPMPEPFEGSIIRGFVYAPIEPFVQIPAQMPASPAGPVDRVQSAVALDDSGTYAQVGGPAVKNVFGSIRRALGGKQGPTELTLIAISNPQSNPALQSKRSHVPLNGSRSHDELRKKRSILAPNPIRIDLLCAAAVESYQGTASRTDYTAFPKTPTDGTRDQNIPAEGFSSLAPRQLNVDRVQSHVTAQSGSILIVDDTGFALPTMTGAVPLGQLSYSSQSGKIHDANMPHEDRHPSYDTQIAFEGDDDEQNPQEDRPEATFSSINPQVDETSRVVENVLPSAASTHTAKTKRSMPDSIQVTSVNVDDADKAETASVQTFRTAEHEALLDGSELKQPIQVLRRRPGGDLRKNQNVQDLESAAPHHESLDSLADTVSSQAESLLIMNGVAPVIPYGLIKPDGLLSREGLKKVSMINTHSSQHLRPSFEAAVAGFSAIPDDDDGGLEATLLKLEGRYEKRSPEINASPSTVPTETFSGSVVSSGQHIKGSSSPLTSRSNASQTKFSPKSANHHDNTSDYVHLAPTQQAAAIQQASLGLSAGLMFGPTESEVSLPLLQRASAAVQQGSFLQKPGIQYAHAATNSADVRGRQGLEPGNDGLGIQTLGNSEELIRPHTAHTDRSFLLGEDEYLSDLSSEMSVDIINYSEAMGSASSPLLVAPGTAISGLEIPSHPLAHSSFVNLPMQSNLALDGNPPSGAHPLTPEPLPMIRRSARTAPRAEMGEQPNNKPKRATIPIGPAHIPFILACDSQMLAQQLTLIEQSALSEIEWVDLVDMRWSTEPAKVLDWAEYVIKVDIKGVDLVVTRFNLMVKWALSEIMLTQDINERVRVISKLIHVAAHARRLHNYATMLQLTIALTSSDCTRLVQTWQQVPAPDRSLLKNMESLIQPIRNFHDLRAEMESADLTDGCIPFIGLYVHDLTYNSQKPSQIDAGKNRPPLINFERFRTTAIIVKGLLRLIDASSRYDFEPINGVIERCLWIAALEEERIRALSKTLEVVQPSDTKV